ncbi:MAG: DUF1330 domain-containing protein [Burkholderiaceae bacterium]
MSQAKGYLVAKVRVTDPGKYAAQAPAYGAATAQAQARYHGRALVKGGRHAALEGNAFERNVILEFPSFDDAVAYFHSEDYQAAKALLEGAAEFEMVAVEGVAPQ